MTCPHCGASAPEGAIYCPVCGAVIAALPPAPARPAIPPEAESRAGGILAWGIVSLVFCEIPILGIILAAIANGKASRFLRAWPGVGGRARVGAILSKVALIVSIAVTSLYGLIFLLGFLGIYGDPHSKTVPETTGAGVALSAAIRAVLSGSV